MTSDESPRPLRPLPQEGKTPLQVGQLYRHERERTAAIVERRLREAAEAAAEAGHNQDLAREDTLRERFIRSQ